MFSFRARHRLGRLAILHVTDSGAEWCDDSGSATPHYAQAAVRGATVADLASAAVEARRMAGGEQKTCVLTLGGKLAEQRVIALPDMARRELGGVLPRKAANLLDIELDEVLFAATPLDADVPTEPGAPAERRWFLLATRRSLLTGLTSALRGAHIEVKSWTSATLDRLTAAQALCADPNAACIVIDVDLADVVVSLTHGADLRTLNRIRGSFASAPTLALSLIQEVKSVDAYWRKHSRGAGVQQVVVLGIDVERAKLFGSAIASALPGSTVVVRPDDATAPTDPVARAQAHRIVSMSACRMRGAFSLDVALPAPPRKAALAGVAGGALLVAGAAGAVLRDRMSREQHALERERLALEEQSVDFDEVRRENRRVEALLRQAALETARLAALRETGVPLGSVLDAGFGVIDAHAELLTLSASRFAGEGELRFVARAPDAAVDAVRSLKAIEQGLAASPWIANPVLEPPTVRSARNAGGSSPFEGRAEWEVPR